MTRPPVILAELVDDFRAECSELDALVAALPTAAWQWPTPAEGWTVANQIQHLSKTDELTALAVLDPDAYVARRQAASPAAGPTEPADLSPADILASWRVNAAASASALAAADPASRVPWVGRTMSPLSSAAGMNSLGGTAPRSGCVQRISASNPTISPVNLAFG